MAIIKCPECNKDVSDKAASCPNCGNPINCSIKCPKCGSENTKAISGANKIMSIYMFGILSANKVMSKYECGDCRHKFH